MIEYNDIKELPNYPKIPLKRCQNIVDQQFGEWTVLYRTINSGSHPMWVCKCSCGTIRPVRAELLKNGQSSSCGHLHIKDLTNQRFGKLTALENTFEQGHGGFLWRCKCDCGNIIRVGTGDLTGGHVKSCGCLQKECASEANLKDITGQRFGRLLAIKRLNKTDLSGTYYYECKCDCGNIVEINGKSLRGGHTLSCGCYNKELSAERGKLKALDLINQRFGKLTVLEKTEKRYRNEIIWKCKCDCGNIIYTYTNNLTSNRKQSCGCLRSNGEEKIANILNENNLSFTQQKTFLNCVYLKTQARLRFDFYIDNKYLIEYDGEQHFRITSGWNDEIRFMEQKQRDEFKNQWCKENNIPLIRIPYWYYDDLCLEDLLLETTQFRVA